MPKICISLKENLRPARELDETSDQRYTTKQQRKGLQLPVGRRALELAPREAVLLLVRLVEPDAGVELPDELVRLLLPHVLLDALDDVLPAADDHLVGNLRQHVRHPLLGVVVPGDGVDHLPSEEGGRGKGC